MVSSVLAEAPENGSMQQVILSVLCLVRCDILRLTFDLRRVMLSFANHPSATACAGEERQGHAHHVSHSLRLCSRIRLMFLLGWV
jgi:hypothetical protein